MARLKGNKILTLSQWWDANGFSGVSRECMIKAQGTGNPRLKKLVKQARISNISRRNDG